MSLSRVKVWIAGEVLTASDLNAEFNNILNNSDSLIFPISANITWKSGTTFNGILDHANTADRTYTFQDSSDTLVGRATTDTLTNKTLTSPVMTTPTLGAAVATSINFGGATLSNFAQGTFTPTVAFGGAAVGVGYTTQYGRYQSIGRIMTANFFIVLSSKGSSSGGFTASGLPSASAATQSTPCSATYTGLSATSIVGNITSVVQAGTSSMTSFYNGTGGNVTQFTDATVTNTVTVIGQCIYEF